MNFILDIFLAGSIIQRMLKHKSAGLQGVTVDRPPKPRQDRDAPSHLLDAAQMVFARDGLKGSSIRAMAKEAGCDPSLFYYYYENKEAVFGAILDRKFGRLIPDLEKIARAHADERGTPHTHLANSFAQRGNSPSMAKGRNATEKWDANIEGPTPEAGGTPLQKALWQTMMTFRRHLKNDVAFRTIIRENVSTAMNASSDSLQTHIFRVITTVSAFFEGGIQSGELRADLDSYITTFFFLRLCIELMDVFPVFHAVFFSIPQDEVSALADQQWFKLFWTGIANTSAPLGSVGVHR